MVIVTAMPPDLIASVFERYKMPGAKLPFRFVPEYADKKQKTAKKDVKIRFSASIEKQFLTFHSGNAEEAIELIRIHKTIVTDMKLAGQIENAKNTRKANKVKIATLKATTLQRATHVTQISDLETVNDELKGTITSLRSDAFDLFEKLLGPNLIAEWHKIVQLECNSADYVSLNGEKGTEIRGKILGALQPCYFGFMKLFCRQDAAERMRHYLITNMFINLDRGITIEQGGARFWDMKQKLVYLNCLKHK